ncbi:hypothetical protein Tco_1204884 [Tanacetum coccineum]
MRNVTVITLAVNLWLAGRCPPILAEFVASAPLTPLLKPDNRIRPIAHRDVYSRHTYLAASGCSKLGIDEGTVIGDSKRFPKTNLVSSYAFVASRAQSWVLQDHILCDSDIYGMDDDYVFALACLRDTIPSFDFSVFECLRAPHAQDFLLAILIDGLGQHMSPVEYHTILKYRLMIPLFLVDAICPVCRKACLDSFGEHVVHCKALSGYKYRHDMVRDVLFDICRRVGISAKKKAPINFITHPSDGRSTLRPALMDGLVLDGWGNHAVRNI